MAADPAEVAPFGNGLAVPVRIHGVEYRSARSAALALGMSQSAITYRLNSSGFPAFVWVGRPRGPGSRGRFAKTFEEREIGRPLQEPSRWPFDGNLTRRADVLDPNETPPRVVRRVGWLRCIRCRRPTFSDDVRGIRLCFTCGGLGSDAIGPKPIALHDIRPHPPKPARPNPSGHRPHLF